MRVPFKTWLKNGDPWIWLNAGAVAISMIMVFGILLLIAVRGLAHFWAHDVMQAEVILNNGERGLILGELADQEEVPTIQLKEAGYDVSDAEEFMTRNLMKIGNRDVAGADFRWVIDESLENRSWPENVIVLERREWGNFYGFMVEVKEHGKTIATGDAAWLELLARIQQAEVLHESIRQIEKHDIGSINARLERLRLKERRLELSNNKTPEALADLATERAELDLEYKSYQTQLQELYKEFSRSTLLARTVDGQQVEINLSHVVRAYQPNSMSLFAKVQLYLAKLYEFVSDEPREANTEGGIFPAIFGTVLMVLIMSIMVTPFGVVAAVYLREYAHQGATTRILRIAVNNLAGVPAIVYGVFGLGFFIYFLGSGIDQAFFPEALPSPTMGTGGLLWASITLAILTLPVVIVATEEGLARIPRSIREGSLALGATKAETLWRVVLPMASPAMMTGVILAIARAAGEVAPLMLVGVVKLAPSLPLDGNYPYLHLDQKFMHLGFHIYDVGFQSPNVEAARPLVYATSLLLVLVIALLNLSAVSIRNRLREKYKALDV